MKKIGNIPDSKTTPEAGREGQTLTGRKGTVLAVAEDCLLSLLASLLALLLVRWLSEPMPRFTSIVFTWLTLSLSGMLLGIFASGLHRIVRCRTARRSGIRTACCVLVKEAILAAVLMLGAVTLPGTAYAVLAVLFDIIFTALFLYYIRMSARLFSRNEVEKVREMASRPTAVISGTTQSSVALCEKARTEGRYTVLGYLSADSSMDGRIIGDLPVFRAATTEEIESLQWELGGIDCILFPKEAGSTPPRGTDNGASKDAGDKATHDATAWNALRRGTDIVLSGLLMIAFLPLGLVCALAVAMEDGSPVIYRQRRIGLGGHSFQILKFRSMRTDAEAGGVRLCAGRDDERLTRVGAFLRAHHLDELPQLWNVFRGDMSFIGYRPERETFIGQIMESNPRYRCLYRMRPGITSYATLYNGYTDTLEKMLTRLDLDLHYLRHRSLSFDARILMLTFLSIASGKKF